MDIARIIVILWIMLPILVIGLFMINKRIMQGTYPATTKGKVIDLSTGIQRINDPEAAITSNLGYQYTIKGMEYTGQELPKDKPYKPGDKITVLYNLAQPQESSVWELFSKEAEK